MLDELTRYFDHYIISARFKPIFFTIVPAIVTVLAWFSDAKTVLGGLLTFLISFGIMAFLSGYVSNRGNALQDRLYASWGGAPTTIIMRNTDSTLDPITKSRYRKCLASKVNGLVFPEPGANTMEQHDEDKHYKSATNFLREYTRDKKKYPAIYRDNIAYGFSRNLLALKTEGLWLSGIALILNAYLVYRLTFAGETIILSIESLLKHYWLQFSSVLTSFIMIIVYSFVINIGYVRGRAFRYAKSLYEACE